MIKDWIEAIRPRTLPVSVAGVIAASALACYHHTFQPVPSLLCFLFALLAQIASNFANEYFDFKNGADKKGRVGPRRGVTEGTITPNAMLRATFITLFVACLLGLGLVYYSGWWLILVGLLIAIGALAYSAGPYPLSRIGLGDVAVFIFFGIIAVNFTFYLQSGYFSWSSVVTSIAIGLLSVNVLIVNNYRDANDDRTAGKKTTVVIFGRKTMGWVYLINGYVAMFVMLPLWFIGNDLFIWVILPIVYLVLHTVTWHSLTTLIGKKLNPVLGLTARNMLIFAALLLFASLSVLI